jgi:hypothetical protein
MRRRAANAVEVRRVVYLGDPPAARRVGALDAAYGRGMDSHAGVIWRNGADERSRKFAGELGPLQHFRGGAGSTASLLRSPNVALPATSSPPSTPNPVLATMRRMGT